MYNVSSFKAYAQEHWRQVSCRLVFAYFDFVLSFSNFGKNEIDPIIFLYSGRSLVVATPLTAFLLWLQLQLHKSVQ